MRYELSDYEWSVISAWRRLALAGPWLRSVREEFEQMDLR